MDDPPNRRVAVLFHVYDPLEAPSAARAAEFSSEAAAREAAEDVAGALEAGGYEAELLPLEGDLAAADRRLRRLRPSLVFNLAEGFRWESRHEAHVAAWLEFSGHAYTGSDPLALGLCRDKGLARSVLGLHGVRVPPGEVLPRGRFRTPRGLSFPLLVKPASEDGSAGVGEGAVVGDAAELRRRVEAIWEGYGGDALVEEFLGGEELNAAFLGNPPRLLPLAQVDYSLLPAGERRILSYDAKWVPGSAAFRGTPVRCPAEIPPEWAEEAEGLARRAVLALGLRDYGRVDLRLDAGGRPHVIDVNPNPDLSRASGLARQARAGGRDYEGLILEVAGEALRREGRHGVAHASAR